MTRTDIKELFPDASKEAIDKILDINSADIGRAVGKQQEAQTQLEGQVKDLTDKLTAMTDQVKTMTGELETKTNAIKTLTEEKNTITRDLNSKYDADVKALNDQLKAAQDKAVVYDSLTEQVTKLKQDVADRDKTIASNNKQYRIKNELRNRHARNVDVVWNMLNIDKITEKDGKLEGFDDQVEAILKSDGYLFDTETSQRGGFPGAQETGGNATGNVAINDAIRQAAGRK